MATKPSAGEEKQFSNEQQNTDMGSRKYLKSGARPAKHAEQLEHDPKSSDIPRLDVVRRYVADTPHGTADPRVDSSHHSEVPGLNPWSPGQGLHRSQERGRALRCAHKCPPP